MTEPAYSILLFAGLLAGPAGAFFIRFELLPVYAVFPLAGLLGRSRRGTLRMLVIGAAPACSLIYGVLSGNTPMVERSMRWIAAVAAGASMSGALGASRTALLLHSASRRLRLGGTLESLAMVVSLAGPFSERVIAVFRSSRKNGRTLVDSFALALSSIQRMEDSSSSRFVEYNIVFAAAATFAWLLLLLIVLGL